MNWEKYGYFALDSYLDTEEKVKDLQDLIKENENAYVFPITYVDEHLGHIGVRHSSFEDWLVDKIDYVDGLKANLLHLLKRRSRVEHALEQLKSYNEKYYDCLVLTILEPSIFDLRTSLRVLGCGSSQKKYKKLRKRALTVFYYFIAKEREKNSRRKQLEWKQSLREQIQRTGKERLTVSV